MFSTDDTIVALATPPGRGGIGVVRISGPAAPAVAARLSGVATFVPRHATLVTVGGPELRDQAILTYFPAPASYTGEDVVEISTHGSPVILHALIARAVAEGARLAEPGEFTLRAYLHGRLDLVQAEAVRDLVDAVTPLQARAAFDQLDGTLTQRIGVIDRGLFDIAARLEASLDFPEEGYHFVEPGQLASEVAGIAEQIAALLKDARRGRLVRDGARVAILGRPNTGKSTLFNALVGAERAIVTDLPGTTRDLVSERVDILGVPLTLVDTAGLRTASADIVEREGIERARQAAATADAVIVVLDASRPLVEEDHAVVDLAASRPAVVVANKSDLAPAWRSDAIPVSAARGEGLDALAHALVCALGGETVAQDAPAITNIRHVALLERAHAALSRARAAAEEAAPEEFVAADITEAREALEEITGRRTADDTLEAIFSRFCIGK